MIWDGFAALATGVLSGWGIGGGSLLMVYMTAIAGNARLTAATVNLLYFIPTAGSSLVFHAREKQVVWTVFVPAVIAGLITAAIAATWSNHADGLWLQKLFGALLCYIGVTELLRKEK
ncbi:MAG: sulfite exporter TauE/SafE family protein [Oscillospiraceae bacterium]|nr:sulfite exporter TauE/SafE family protein [Oscillospiraceae bacterium]